MADENMLFPMQLVWSLTLLYSTLSWFFIEEEHLLQGHWLFQDLPITVLGHGHHIEGRTFWIRPGRTSPWWDKLLSQNREMPKISQSRSFRACTYCLTYETACHSAFSSVLVGTVENAAKTVVWAQMDQSMRFRWH